MDLDELIGKEDESLRIVVLQKTFTSKLDRKENEDILRTVGQKNMLVITCEEKQLSYFGHTAKNNSIQQGILDGRIQGRRVRGRQRRDGQRALKE